MQNKIRFTTGSEDLKLLDYNDCVYAWLLVHSYENKKESCNYIYKSDFTFEQIAKDIHRTRQTVSKRFKEMLITKDNPKGLIEEFKVFGEKAYKIPYTKSFQFLHGETVNKLLKIQNEELIKTLAYILEKKTLKDKENNCDFHITAKELIEAFGHSTGNRGVYDRIRANLAILQEAGILKIRTAPYDNRDGMPPQMYVYYVSNEGRASDEWLGV